MKSEEKPAELLGMPVKLDRTMPVGQIDIEDSKGKRTMLIPAEEKPRPTGEKE